MATEMAGPARDLATGDPAETSPPVSRPVLIGAAAALSLAILGAFVSGDVKIAAALGAFVVVGVLVWGLGLRTFAQFFVAACCARPLVDLTAGPRGSGLALTELFGVGVLAVMLCWLALQWRVVAARILAPLPLALVALVGVYLLAAVGSTDPVGGIIATLRITTGVAVFFVVDALLATRRLRPVNVLHIVLLANVIPVLYPLLGLVGAPVTHQKDDVTALRSVYFLSNNFAFALVPVLLLAIAVAVRARGRMQWTAVAATGVTFVELVLTQTRGAWIAGVVGALIVCALLNRAVAVAAIAALLVAALTVPPITSRIANLASSPDDPYSQSSFAWRLDQWSRLTPDLTVNPVLGGGPGQSNRLTGKEAHNDYLKAAVETGGVGFVVYLWLLLASVSVSWRAWRRVPRDLRRVRALGARAPDATLLVGGLAATAAYSVAVMVGAIGENLIDNVTYLWATLPLFALAQWVASADPEDLRRELGPAEPEEAQP